VARGAKRSEYAVAVDDARRCSANGHAPIEFGADWTPEHLVLAALARCVLTSLAYHARRSSLPLSATARATGAVTERDDGSWGFVEIECRVDAELSEPIGDDVETLLARAERGCFVGGSLRPRPVYRWLVNGAEVRAG
jgi:organic hydroperoxide reductase OsmC/OhrA